MRDQVSTIEGLISTQADTDYVVTPCGDNRYCCGNGTVADNCCKENRGLFLSGGQALVRETTSSASDITSSPPLEATPLSSSSSSSLTSISPSAAAQTSHQTGMIVGSAIGAAAAAAFITGIIFLIRIRRIKHQQLPSREIQQAHGINNFMKSNDTYPELAINGPVPELEESRRPVPELEGSIRSQWRQINKS